ncbi:MAG: 2,3,4,5-tetrahydropyridine-2,6-dicarboxylate N-succinyltransferase [Candidatus Dormibacteraeota bacterium]|nr:2,3,4,5-tetrahydropyridine-2,6-dicarboxylate N-succinyltransferase [Candidatus Dormibacteraeota bacterium]
MTDLRDRVERAYQSGEMDAAAVEEAIRLLDRGEVRSAQPGPEGWVVNDWVKKAILLYFRLRQMETVELGPFEYRDKIPLKHDLEQTGARVVPPAVARYGSFLSPGVVQMPSYVNIGAWVGPDTMVDTWATVGSCAQIGARVHLSGGVGIGGVLEPVNARPVIVEDDCFIGSRVIVTEGVIVRERAVLGQNVSVNASIPVVDVTGPEPLEHRGEVPAGAIVMPGMRTKRYPAGEFAVATPLIVGWRSERQERRLSLEDALREHGIAT